jgi:hypothetical protein
MDQEMIKKTFSKSGQASSTSKPEPPSAKAKPADISKQPKNERSATGSGEVKSGSTG